MALVLNEDQQLLKESATSFFAEQAPVSQLRGLRDTADEKGFSGDLHASMIEMGFYGVLVGEDHGGLDFGLVGAGIIAESMGRTLAASPWLSSAVIGALTVRALASDSQQEDILPGIADGSSIVTLALDETARFDPTTIDVTADVDGDTVTLSGMKTFVPDAHVADTILVVARDSDGIGVYRVPSGTKGLIVDRMTMADSRNWARVTLERVQVPIGNRLGAGDASKAIQNVLDRANMVISSELLGMAESCLEITTQYLRDRKQFGVAIGTFQGLQHRASHWYSENEVTRSAILKAQQTADGIKSFSDLGWFASMVKARAVKTATLATNEAVQMHGGIGMTDEYDIGFYIKRARTLSALYGDEAYHAQRFAVLSGY